MSANLANEIGVAGAKTAPVAAISGLAAVGALDITFWVGVATIGYVVLQAAYLIWKWRREARKRG